MGPCGRSIRPAASTWVREPVGGQPDSWCCTAAAAGVRIRVLVHTSAARAHARPPVHMLQPVHRCPTVCTSTRHAERGPSEQPPGGPRPAAPVARVPAARAHPSTLVRTLQLVHRDPTVCTSGHNATTWGREAAEPRAATTTWVHEAGRGRGEASRCCTRPRRAPLVRGRARPSCTAPPLVHTPDSSCIHCSLCTGARRCARAPTTRTYTPAVAATPHGSVRPPGPARQRPQGP
jgi:hypothetical protein